jgi:hypothetical protein
VTNRETLDPHTSALDVDYVVLFSFPFPRHYVTGTYSNSFTLHNLLTKRTVTIKARDDAREPLVINEHYNLAGAVVGNERPPIGMEWRSNSDTASANGTKQDENANPAAAPGNPAQHFNRLKPNKPPNYRKKVLKVAWHPRINAVAVAGLYKLYLYQATTPKGFRPEI